MINKNYNIVLLKPIEVLKLGEKSAKTASKLRQVGIKWKESVLLADNAWLIVGCVRNKYGHRVYKNADEVFKKLDFSAMIEYITEYKNLLQKVGEKDATITIDV